MSFSVPQDHPRYASLMARHLLEEGVKLGITTMTGLVAHGRGEAFDYLLGERTCEFSDRACKAAALAISRAQKSVISINGNTAMLSADEMISLAKATGALLEINIFHDTGDRRKLIAERFRARGAEVLGVEPDAFLPGLSSHRARVDSRGMLAADLVIVSLEDGDRTEALVKSGKMVVAIDLNPLSRTPRTAQIPVIDHVNRALPLIEKYFSEIRTCESSEFWLSSFDAAEVLADAERGIREGPKA